MPARFYVVQNVVKQANGMSDKPRGFFEGTEMPTAGWWEALWPDPAGVLACVGLMPGMDVIDLCSGDGWFMLQETYARGMGRVQGLFAWK